MDMGSCSTLFSRAQACVIEGQRVEVLVHPGPEADPATPPAAGGTFTTVELVTALLYFAKTEGSGVSETALLRLFVILGELLGLTLPATWKDMEKIFRSVHQPPIRLALCGGCKRYVFSDPKLAVCPEPDCGVRRFASRRAIAAGAPVPPPAIPAQTVAYYLPLGPQIEVLMMNLVFCGLLVDQFGRAPPTDGRMYDIWDGAAAARWKRELPAFFAIMYNLCVSLPADGVNLQKTGRFGGRKSAWVMLAELLSIPRSERRLPKFLLTLMLTTEEFSADMLQFILIALCRELFPLFESGFAVRARRAARESWFSRTGDHPPRRLPACVARRGIAPI